MYISFNGIHTLLESIPSWDGCVLCCRTRWHQVPGATSNEDAISRWVGAGSSLDNVLRKGEENARHKKSKGTE